MKYRYFLPVGAKVYGICMLMLSFLLLVAGGNYLRMARVNQEVQDVAQFIAPIAKNLRQTYLLALEQELLVERILRLKNATPVVSNKSASSPYETQWQQLNRLDKEVDLLLSNTAVLAENAIAQSEIRSDIVAFARLSPELMQLRADHQRLQGFNKTIIQEFQQQSSPLDKVLLRQLDNQEAVFNGRIGRLQNWLNEFTQQSVIEIQRQDHSLLWFNAILTAMALITGLVVAWFTSVKVTTPLKQLITGGEMLRKEQYHTRLQIKSHDEIGELTGSFNQLMQEVENKEKLRASFQDYIDPRIVKLLAEHPSDMAGIRHQASVLFSDLAKFSTLSETLSPEALVAVINEHYNLSGNAILPIGGLVDKYIGDAVVAYWSPPFVDASSHARLACRAALKHLEQMQQLRLSLPDLVGVRKGLPDIDIRIGIATGDIIAGNIGTSKKRSYSILGEPLMLAEALEQTNKRYGTHILVTDTTRQQAGSEFVFCCAGNLELPRVSVRLFQLRGYKEALSDAQIRDIDLLDTHIRQWHDNPTQNSIHAFRTYVDEFLQVWPGDPLAKYYQQVLNVA